MNQPDSHWSCESGCFGRCRLPSGTGEIRKAECGFRNENRKPSSSLRVPTGCRVFVVFGSAFRIPNSEFPKARLGKAGLPKETPMPKLLLVEDNEENRDGLSRHLRRKGFEVLVAVDGQQGVEAAKSGAPDLILMDMSLPVLDGWEATRQLKAAPETKHIPVIALTAHAMAGDREKALQAGCNEYDTKPIDFARLLGKIQALLGGSVSPAGGEVHG